MPRPAAALTACLPSPARPRSSGLRFIARQAILDAAGRVHGYELLHRSSEQNRFSGNGETATQSVLDNTLLFGLATLVGEGLAFVNCTRETLVRRLVTLMPPERTVLEILETVEPDDEVIEACRTLAGRGYRLALDDFVLAPGCERLLELADYVKIDFLASDARQRARALERIAGRGPLLIAEKLETEADFHTALAEGFEYFQGYHFCRPGILESRPIPINGANYLAVLRSIEDPGLGLDELVDCVKREASLCFRLLRLANSALYGLRREITSIKTALLVVGMEQFEKMVMIAISSELGEGRPTELLVMALARARFCELAAPLAGLDGMEQYLIGMVSLMPAILGLPMARLLEMLPLRAAVREALLGRINAERALLTWVEEYERGNWERAIRFADRFRVNEERVARLYSEAIRWSEESLSQVRRVAGPGQLSSAELPEWADRARLTPFSLV